ncbi:hypothetical protein EDD17DRAFT_1656357 [Pisolithus thermaeus]|nr:hypothetical protein EDD17DRAFT_1656357 [Pisolithus thermaeus]
MSNLDIQADSGVHDILTTSPLSHASTSPHDDADVHDLNIHVPQFPSPMGPNISVSTSCQPNLYYSSFDTSTYSLGSYPYPLQDGHLQDSHLDLNCILVPEMQTSSFIHDSPHLMPKQFHSIQDISTAHPSSDHESQYQSSPSSSSSLSYVSPLPDISCPPTAVTTRFTMPPSPQRSSGHTHTMLPPIVQSNPADVAKTESDNRAASKRLNAGASSQVDPYAAAFLLEQLGEAKWNTFSARLFERRLGPIKSKMRVRGKGQNDEPNSAPGATAIDFLVKVEVVKEVLRTYVPHPYNPLKSLSHTFPGSPSGVVTLTRSTILVLSGWSNTQFSYWARRSEGISVLAAHDDRLRAVAVALDKRLKEGGVLIDAVEDGETYGKYSDGGPTVTGKGLDIIIEQVKKRTGLSPFLRGKHSSLDPFGSTNSDKDTGPGPPQGAPAAPVYMPTFQAMQYSHSPAITAPESISVRRPKKKRRTSLADSVSSYASSGILGSERSDFDESTINRYSLMLSENRLTPDQESVSSSDMQPISPPSSIALPQLLARPRGMGVGEGGLSLYELSTHGSMIGHGAEEGRPEYFPVSNSRSDFDISDTDSSPRKRFCGIPDRNLEKRPKLST